MSANNSVHLFGRLTRDPDFTRNTEDEKRNRVEFTVAVDRRTKDTQDADFVNCVAFGFMAEKIYNYFSKGRGIIVNGHLRIESYTDKEGIKRKSTQVIVEDWSFDSARKGDAAPAPTPGEALPAGLEEAAEDIPF